MCERRVKFVHPELKRPRLVAFVRYTKLEMSERRPANLRNVLSFAAILVTLLAATAAISLVLATSVLRRMTANIANSVESVRVIEEAEVSLLLHVRAYNRGEQSKFASELQQLMDQARVYATTTEEKAVFAEADAAVDKYLALSLNPNASPAGIKRFETAAINALELLGDLDVAQTRAAQARAKARGGYGVHRTGEILGCLGEAGHSKDVQRQESPALSQATAAARVPSPARSGCLGRPALATSSSGTMGPA